MAIDVLMSAQSDKRNGVATVGMAHRARGRRAALTAAVLAAALTASLTAGCSGDRKSVV